VGNIALRPNGKYRARYRDADGKEHCKHFELMRDAKRWLVGVESSILSGDYVDPAAGALSFEAYYRTWREHRPWQDTTRRAMDLAALSVPFGSVPLGKIRRSMLERWVGDMQRAGLAATTIRTRVNNVRAVLRSAVAERLIARDPSEGLALPRTRRAAASMRIPTVEEVGAALSAADDRWRPMFALCAFAGLRIGEAAAVQVGDVHFPRRRLVVSRQVQRLGGGKVQIRAPKYESEREVGLADPLLEMLALHIERHVGGADRRSCLFTAASGGPAHQNTATHQWHLALGRAGLTGIKIHDLRHFYASGLIAAGCTVVTVQRALGHGKASTTLNTYTHLWPDAEDHTRDAADRLMSEAVEALSLIAAPPVAEGANAARSRLVSPLRPRPQAARSDAPAPAAATRRVAP
jgi:integrase